MRDTPAGAAFDPPISTSNLVPPDRALLRAYLDLLPEPGGEARLVALMERRFAAFHDVPHCVALVNGFWALVACLRALAIPGRDEVVMPSLTYRRMADVAAWAGLRPRFCEVDAATLAMTPATVAPLLGEGTAILLAVHPVVGTCDAAGLAALGRRRRVPVLFDAVESAYEVTPEGRVGRFGEAEVFSLHASKLVNGFEGGYVTTLRPGLARRLAAMRDHGEGSGLNARLSGLHAAAALASLDGIEAQVAHNRTIHAAYASRLAGVPGLRVVPFPDAGRSAFKNVLVEIDPARWPLTRDGTVRRLNDAGALARAHYAPPLHRKPMTYPHVPARLPVTEALAERFILMPCGHRVSVADVASLAELLAGFAGLPRGAERAAWA